MAVKGVAGLEEALWNMYVEEEYFENENLYRCGACDKLVEASKVMHWSFSVFHLLTVRNFFYIGVSAL